jgi:hypothetical protein
MSMDRSAHLSALRLFNGIFAFIFFGVALLFIVVWCIPGLLAILHGRPIGWAFLLGGLVCATLTGAIGSAHWKVAVAVVDGRRRVLMSALAALHLFNFPIGTAFAVYALWVAWFNQPTKVFFDVQDRRL